MNKFTDYNFKQQTKAFIEYNQFITPTPIQKEVIPYILKNKNVIGIAQTGTGKTHAFLIPIMERIDTTKDEVQVVISAPTRELAMQIYTRAKEMNEIDSSIDIRLITGGIDRIKMSGQLKKQPHIVVATPGRLKDLFINEKLLRLDSVSLFVVDEADMTLEYGFLEDIDAVAGKMRRDLQMLSFSATIPQQLQIFLKKYMTGAITVNINSKEVTNTKIDHILVPCKHKSYEEKLLEILPKIKPYVCLIFANTRKDASSVASALRDKEIKVVELHGDLQPRERKNAMKNIMNLQESYVVATDIAARGIDIDGVSHVISLGFPKESAFYIHRSGRTARAGRDGICYALYNEKDEAIIKELQIKGIGFKHQDIKNNEWVDLNKFGYKRKKKDDPLEKEIAKIVQRKKTKVKPGYKVKRNEEISKLKRKAKRAMIQESIKQQQKEKSKAKQKERGER